MDVVPDSFEDALQVVQTITAPQLQDSMSVPKSVDPKKLQPPSTMEPAMNEHQLSLEEHLISPEDVDASSLDNCWGDDQPLSTPHPSSSYVPIGSFDAIPDSIDASTAPATISTAEDDGDTVQTSETSSRSTLASSLLGLPVVSSSLETPSSGNVVESGSPALLPNDKLDEVKLDSIEPQHSLSTLNLAASNYKSHSNQNEATPIKQSIKGTVRQLAIDEEACFSSPDPLGMSPVPPTSILSTQSRTQLTETTSNDDARPSSSRQRTPSHGSSGSSVRSPVTRTPHSFTLEFQSKKRSTPISNETTGHANGKGVDLSQSQTASSSTYGGYDDGGAGDESEDELELQPSQQPSFKQNFKGKRRKAPTKPKKRLKPSSSSRPPTARQVKSNTTEDNHSFMVEVPLYSDPSSTPKTQRLNEVVDSNDDVAPASSADAHDAGSSSDTTVKVQVSPARIRHHSNVARTSTSPTVLASELTALPSSSPVVPSRSPVPADVDVTMEEPTDSTSDALPTTSPLTDMSATPPPPTSPKKRMPRKSSSQQLQTPSTSRVSLDDAGDDSSDDEAYSRAYALKAKKASVKPKRVAKSKKRLPPEEDWTRKTPNPSSNDTELKLKLMKAATITKRKNRPGESKKETDPDTSSTIEERQPKRERKNHSSSKGKATPRQMEIDQPVVASQLDSASQLPLTSIASSFAFVLASVAPCESQEQRKADWGLLRLDNLVWAFVKVESKASFWWPADIISTSRKPPLHLQLLRDEHDTILKFLPSGEIDIEDPQPTNLLTFRTKGKVRFDKSSYLIDTNSPDVEAPSIEAFESVLLRACALERDRADAEVKEDVKIVNEEEAPRSTSRPTKGQKDGKKAAEKDASDDELLHAEDESEGIEFPSVALGYWKKKWWGCEVLQYIPASSQSQEGHRARGKFLVQFTDGIEANLPRKHLLLPHQQEFKDAPMGDMELDVCKNYDKKLRKSVDSYGPTLQAIIDETFPQAKHWNDEYHAGGNRRIGLSKDARQGEFTPEHIDIILERIKHWSLGEDNVRRKGSERYEALNETDRSRYNADVLLPLVIHLCTIDDLKGWVAAKSALLEEGIEEPDEAQLMEKAFEFARAELSKGSVMKTILTIRSLARREADETS